MTISRDRKAIFTSGTKAVPLMGRWIGLTKPEQIEARRQKWLELRQRSLGASDVPSLFGCDGAYSSEFALWWAKQDGAPIEFGDMTEEQEWGLRFEDAIADKFADNHRTDLHVFKPTAHMWRHPDYEWVTCSPDRLTVDTATGRLRPLELKTDQNPDRWGDDPVEAYDVQLMWQCAVFGVNDGYLAAVINKRYREYARHYDQEEIDTAIGRAEVFWLSLKGDPPEVDGHDATRQTLARLMPGVEKGMKIVIGSELVAEYETASDGYRDAKAAKKLAENRLRQAMGMGHIAIDEQGRKVADRRVFKHPGSTVAPHMVDGIWRA